jgi:hypothetical protein
LCRALLEAYPTRDHFAEVLFDLERNLDVIAAAHLDLELTVRRVVRRAGREGWLPDFEAAAMAGNPGSPALRVWHESHCARAAIQPQAVTPDGLPAEWQQFSPVYFDLKPIRAALLQTIIAASEPVLGFGVTYGDYAFVDKLQDVVIGHLDGETLCQRPLSLKPHHGRVSSKVERVRRHLEDISTVNVLRVVHVDAVPADHLAEFWAQVRQLLSASSRYVVLLFIGDASTTFPPGVTVLPPPRFDRDDLTLWAANTVMQIKWPVSLAHAWADLLCVGASDGPELDIGMVYEAMDKSINEIRFDAAGFRRKLESRVMP